MDTSGYIPWKFTTKSGNTYIYDKFTNMVIPCSEYQYGLICEYQKRSIIPEDNYIHNLIRCGLFTNHGEFCGAYENIEEIFNQAPAATLILDITEQCNLRCSYCIYGEEYSYCKYSNKKMDFAVARKSVDYFWNNYCERIDRGIIGTPTIIFYGGEPLMNYEMIVKTVNYCHEKDYIIKFSVTTNATLLTKEISKFLVDNSFQVTISLDGEREETNKRRIYANGAGTFDDIWKGLMNLVDYCKSNDRAPNLTFNVCFDYASDMKKIMKFFNDLEDEIGNLFVNLSRIANINTTYYSRFSPSDISNYRQAMDDILNSFFEVQKNSRTGGLEKYTMFLPFFQFKSRFTTPIKKHCNTCQLGRKMAVSSDGKIYICEKANRDIPIGDIFEGINWEKLNSLIDSMNSIRCQNCSDCDVSGMCELCYVQFMKNGKLVFDKEICEEQKKKIKGTMISCYEVLEKNPMAFEK